MADIAMLVAEEYERRVKNSSRKEVSVELEGDGNHHLNLVSSVSIVAKGVGDMNKEFVKRVLEPKTQIGLAAFDGFFSA